MAENIPAHGTLENIPAQGTLESIPAQGTLENIPAQGTLENIPAQGTLENIPRGLLTILGELNDSLHEKYVNLLAYLFNERREGIKKSTDLLFVLNHQRRINCHLFERYLGLIGLNKLSSCLKDELSKSGNEDFKQQDFEDVELIEKSLDRTEGTLSKRSLKFRELLIEILELSNFSKEVGDNIRMYYELPAVVDDNCGTLLDVFLYDEKRRSDSNEVVDFLKNALMYECQDSYVKKLTEFVINNQHLFI